MQEEKIQEIAAFILSLDPRMEQRMAYGLPFFYYGEKRFAYISPQKEKWIIGWILGKYMDHDHGWFTALDRKQIRHLSGDWNSPIPYEKIKHLCLESIQLIQAGKKG